ncbi:MAG: o-succinylbenzoate synthase, partial [Bacteroidota bacterium]
MPTLSVFRYRLPLVRPLPLRGHTVTVREGLLVRLKDGGYTGWGDVAPLPGFSAETIDEATHALQALAGMTADDLVSAQHDEALPPSVRYGLALAAWDLDAHRRAVPLPTVLAEEASPTVPLNGLLAGDADTILHDATRLAQAGYRTLKLKVGRGDLAEEAALVRDLHAAHPAVALRLDANRAWAYDEARRFAEALGDAQIEYIEEPLTDPAKLADFAAETGLPVALDESATAMEPDDLDAHAYARAIVLKPTFLGGTRAWALATRAQALGLRVTWSAAFESGVGLRGLVVMAAATGTPTATPTPAGLDTYRWLAADVFAPDAAALPLGTPLVAVADALAPRALDVGRLTPVALQRYSVALRDRRRSSPPGQGEPEGVAGRSSMIDHPQPLLSRRGAIKVYAFCY